MPRHMKRILAVCAALLPLMVAYLPAATALDPLPIPGDTNCTFSYGSTVGPAGTLKYTIRSFGGNTSCSGNVKTVVALAFLYKGAKLAASGGPVAHGPSNGCNSCANTGSHGGPYGPVTAGSTWTVDYMTGITLKSNEKWTGSLPNQCSQSGQNLDCNFLYLFTPLGNGVQSSDAELTSIAIATAT